MVATHQDNPGKPHQWEALLRKDAQRKKRLPLMAHDVHLRFAFGPEVGAFLDRRGLRLSGQTLDGFVMAYLDAKERAARLLLRNAAGNYEDDPDAGRFGSPDVLTNGGKVPALDMFDRYAKEAGLSPKTYNAWKAKISSLIAFVKHDDLARLTTKNVIKWKDDLLAEKSDGSKLDPKTVRNGYLAALKATLSYGVQQQDLTENVAKGVTVRVKKKKKQREKGFTADEARLILRATFLPSPRNLSAEHAAARRRVPWICAYTGARVSSLARHVDMHIDVQNVIQGHAGERVASDYGDTWIEAAYREILKIPKYVLDDPAAQASDDVSKYSDQGEMAR